MIDIHRVTYDPWGDVYCETSTPIVNPIHHTHLEFVKFWVTGEWTAISERQIATVDGAGFLDVVTYLEKGE